MIALGCLECLEVAQVGSGMITNGAHFRLVLCIQGFGRVPSPPGVRSDDWGIPMLCSISDLEDLNWLPGTGSCWMALSLSKSLPFLEVVGLNKSTSSLDVCLDFKRPCICETKGKSLEIMRIYCANIVLMYCIYIYIYMYICIYIYFVYFTTGGVKYLDDTNWRKSGMNHHLWSKFWGCDVWICLPHFGRQRLGRWSFVGIGKSTWHLDEV